jgi:hypothetical protein
MPAVKVALAAGLTITVAAIALVLATPPIAVLASNATLPNLPLNYAGRGVCQAGERLPAGTHALRLSLYAFTGPRVTVEAIAGTRVLSYGKLSAGWSGASITVPVTPVSKSVPDVKICALLATIGERVVAYGTRTDELETGAEVAHTIEGEALPGRMSIQYMGNGHTSWLPMISSVADHMSLGRAWSGIWVVFFVGALMLAVVALATRLVLSELDD